MVFLENLETCTNIIIPSYGGNSVQNEYNSLLAKNTMHAVHRQ